MQTYDSGLGYKIISGSGSRSELGLQCRSLFGDSEAYILSDSNVGGLWLRDYEESLSDRGIAFHSYEYEAGEGNKSLRTLSEFIEFMLKNGVSRNDYVIGLGGGVTGDMAGFAASVCLRGIRYVQAPTTLLSAVDSSIGGKTGIDFGGYKNSVGSFHNPSLVLFDTDTLSTLPEKEFHSGTAEIIKYGAIGDRNLFEKTLHGLGSSEISDSIVTDCVKIKLNTVGEDPYDNGVRKLLNFGHTFGHAYEVLSGFSITHGEAVAAGMVTAAELSYKMGICDSTVPASIKNACSANGLPTEYEFSKDSVINTIKQDKKHFADTIDFVFVQSIGNCKIINTEISRISDTL